MTITANHIPSLFIYHRVCAWFTFRPFAITPQVMCWACINLLFFAVLLNSTCVLTCVVKIMHSLDNLVNCAVYKTFLFRCCAGSTRSVFCKLFHSYLALSHNPMVKCSWTAIINFVSKTHAVCGHSRHTVDAHTCRYNPKLIDDCAE